MKFIRAILLIFIICLLFSNVYSQQLIDGIAAIINERIILHSEIDEEVIKYLTAQGLNKSDITKDAYEGFYDSALQSLLEKQIQLVLADHDTTVTVTDEEVANNIDQRIQMQVQQYGSQEAFEQAFETTIDDLRPVLLKLERDNLLIQRLQLRVVSEVSAKRSEIESFYTEYKDSLPPVPDSFIFSHILKTPMASSSKETEMDSILYQLRETGSDFEELARIHSEYPGADVNGGDLGWLEPGTVFPEFDSVATALNIGEISEVFRTTLGLHIFQLMERDSVRYKARHIFKFLNPTQDDYDRSMEELKGYRDRALEGENFGDLAVEHSDDPGAVENRGQVYGEWDPQRLQQLLPEFVPYVLGKIEGEISDPFQTQFGIHIVRIDTFIPGRQRSMEEDYEYIKELATTKKQNEYYITWLEEEKQKLFIDIKVAQSDTSAVKK
ncbi:peptidylprolyl isomerase [candidate division KSB1 bacterium]